MKEPKRCNWTKIQGELIHLVKKYKVYEMQDEKVTMVAWNKISDDLKLSVDKCRRLWDSLSMVYKRLKLMIIEGKLSESEARKNYWVAKYVDGSLAFLEPFVLKAPPDEIEKIKNHANTKRILSHLLRYDIDKSSSVPSSSRVRKRRFDLSNFTVKHCWNTKQKYPLETYMDDLARAICTSLQPADRRMFIKEIDTIVSDLLQK